MKYRLFVLRCLLANALFRLGIWAIPAGPARAEMIQLLDLWRTKVERTVRTGRERMD